MWYAPDMYYYFNEQQIANIDLMSNKSIFPLFGSYSIEKLDLKFYNLRKFRL